MQFTREFVVFLMASALPFDLHKPFFGTRHAFHLNHFEMDMKHVGDAIAMLMHIVHC